MFQGIIDAADFEMTQIQLNILDEHQQAGVAGLKYAQVHQEFMEIFNTCARARGRDVQ